MTDAPLRTGRPTLPRHLQLEVQVLDGGRIRLSSPQAVGHAVVVRGPHQLWQGLQQTLREVAVAGYARWSGSTYDQEALSDLSDTNEPAWKRSARRSGIGQGARDGVLPVSYSSRSPVRPDQANPGAWSPLQDGRWRSPSGRIYRADTRYVRGVIVARAKLGLSISWTEEHGDVQAAAG